MVKLYPFTGQYFDRGDGVRLHYLDEGSGPPVVMLHGNPTWSFYYRGLIADLRTDFRCVAPDHVGCGLSDKPPPDRYAYTLRTRLDDFSALMDRLGLDGVTLVLHDWGGMIGTAWAVRNPGRVKRLVVSNTAGFRMIPGKRLPLALRLGRDTSLGAWLIRRWNLFARSAVWFAAIRPLAKDVRDGYLAPYDTPDHRIATLKFVQDIPLSPGDPGYDIVAETEENLHRLRDKPVMLCWGMRDFVFDGDFLNEWRRHFPKARTHRFSAGHYLLEDAGDRVIPLVREFCSRDGDEL